MDAFDRLMDIMISPLEYLTTEVIRQIQRFL